jgi:hypothetical protein
LEDYLEGGLDFPGRFGMERHAQQCFSCGKIVADAQELSRKARECNRVAAPPGFETAVMKRIQAATAERGFRHPFQLWSWSFGRPPWRLLAAGASGIALLGLGIFFTLRFVPRARPGAEPSVAALQARPEPAPAVQNANPPRTADLSRQKSLESATMRNTPDLPLQSVDLSDSGYVELLIPDDGGRMRVVRLPSTIRMRYGQPSEQYFIRNVSH